MTPKISLSAPLRLQPLALTNDKSPSLSEKKLLRTSGHTKSDLAPPPPTLRHFLEDDLRHAWRTKAFDLVYQPQVDLITHQVTAFEALMRWHHPVHGTIAPTDFIAIAESIGLIDDIGQWVLNLTCHIATTWPDQIGLAVNVSALQLQDPSFPVIVAKVLRSSGLKAERLELEITETAVISTDPASLRVLHTIRKTGVRIAMDDFDAGYSGLGYLLQFPYDKIKMDRSFIAQLSHTEERHVTARSIVRAVIALCHDLDIAFVAEGVETAEQLSILMAENCTSIQGYFVGWPQAAPSVSDTILEMSERLQGLQTAKKLYPKMSLEGTGDNISFLQIAETSRDMIMITTAQMAPPGPAVVYVNPAFTKMTGYSLADMIGHSPRMLQGAATDRAILNRMRQSLETGRSIQEQLVNYTKSGVSYVVDLDIVGLRDPQGKITHFAATQRNVTLAKHLQAEQRARPDSDPLTGLDMEDLFSRRLQTLMSESHNNADASPSVTAYLILIDIDSLNLLLKRMTVEISDCVVRGVAHCLAENIRRSDSLGRLKDGTFAVCLPASTLPEAKDLAERLRNAVAQTRLATPLGLMNVTISLGLNGLRLGDTVSTLTLRAATALSAAQQAGQNRVRMAASTRRGT